MQLNVILDATVCLGQPSKTKMADTIGRMFGPLNFKEYHPKNLEDSEQTPCLLCDNVFNLKLCFNVFLQHLFEVHHLVIEDVQNIYNLSRYIKYWKNRFEGNAVESVVPSVKVEPSDQSYLLLSSLMKEDKELRMRLSLERALDAQEVERTDDKFEKDCLFCRLQHKGTRYEYLDHLSGQHNLHLGNPQNLVFIDELIQQIEEKLNSLQCIYCEKTFTERPVLKEHMRKKLHKRVNPQNHNYDKYYMINYLEERARKSRKCKDLNADDEDDLPIEPGEQNSDAEYSDWEENEDVITCLFCEHTEFRIGEICLHMQTVHRFNFPQVSAHLDFYQRVKLVNYLRRQVHGKVCPKCDEKCGEGLLGHLREMKHCEMPDIKKFDQPEFYFPTYENDTFLYFLEDIED